MWSFPFIDQMNGDVACRAIRPRLLTDVIIIATTGNCSETDVDKYIANGFDAVLPKPFNTADIRQVLTRLLEALALHAAVTPDEESGGEEDAAHVAAFAQAT